jgi:hypothetical protein
MWREWMRLEPQSSSNFQRISSQAAPPSRFITEAVELTVVTAAQRKGELVAYSAGESTALREAKVVRIGRKPAAHEGSQVKQAVLIIGLGLRHS